MNSIWVLLLFFLVSLGMSLFLVPRVIRIAVSKGFVDKPDERKMHKEPVPYGGGVAVSLSFFLVILIGISVLYFKGYSFSSRDLLVLGAFLLGGMMAAMTGFVDDVASLRPLHKLLLQILSVFAVIPFGVAITFVSNPFGEGVIYLHKAVVVLVTLFWIVGIMNAVNLLDGLDGLLGGVTVISAFVFLIVSFMKGNLLIAGVMVVLAGSALGFLKYNFYPAKIFMGDTGSLFIGMIFAIASVIGGLKTTTTVAILIPFLIMGLPIVDTCWAIIRRAKNRQPIFKADKGHIHHRLLAMGMTQKQAVLFIYGINILLGGIALAICYFTL